MCCFAHTNPCFIFWIAIILVKQIKYGYACHCWLQRWDDTYISQVFADAKVTKTEMSPNLKCHQNRNVLQNEM